MYNTRLLLTFKGNFFNALVMLLDTEQRTWDTPDPDTLLFRLKITGGMN